MRKGFLRHRTRHRRPHPLVWLLSVSLALSVANGLILPAFEAMDEPEHFNFMRYLAEGNGLPDQRDFALAEDYGFCQEGGQAPLYYLLGALVLRGLDEDVSDVAALTEPNPLSTCGDTSQTYSKGLWLRKPRRDTWPYHGAALGVHVIRLFSSVLALFTICGVYMTAKEAFPEHHTVALVAAALVGFNPRFLTHSATITNDNLLAALSAWGVYLTVRTLRKGPSLPQSLALGVVAGLSALTKTSGILLLPLVVLALADVAWRERAGTAPFAKGGWTRSLWHVGIVALLCAAIGGWWYAANLVRYGNPGLMPLLTEGTGQREQWPMHLVVLEIIHYLGSYWSFTPYCEIRVGFLPVYAGLSLLGLAGLVLRVREAEAATRRTVALLLVWTGVVFLAWFRFNSMVWAPDGRYLFPAHAAIGPLLAAGLLRLVGRWSNIWRGLVVGLGLLALGTPLVMLASLFVPPPRYSADQAPIAHPLEATFGERVMLHGYDVNSESLQAGDTVDVTLYLGTERPITENLTLWLQLVSAAPHDDSVLVNLRSWPGGGNYPTTAWEPGEILADRYQLRLPADVPELQLWGLRLLCSRPSEEGEYELLPVRVGGVPGDTYVTLTYLRVEPSSASAALPPASAVLPSPPAFGSEQEIVLAAAEVAPDGEALNVKLWWRVHKPLNGAYVVFVQLLDEDWMVLATGDGPPRDGAMPTEYWRSGDVIVDEHRMLLPEGLLAQRDGKTYRVGVGLYNTQGRLPAWDSDGRPLPEDTALIGRWR